MKNRIILSLIIFILSALFFYQCNEDSITSPEIGENLITNPSFEENGNASLAGWIIAGDTLNQFTNEVPSGGGNWAVTINSVWISPLVNGIYTTVKLSPGTHIYRFTVFAKYQKVKGNSNLLIVNRDTTIIRRSIQIVDTLWKQYSLIDTITAGGSDSLRVVLSGGSSQLLLGKTFFDLCTFEIVE
jgi:hypothetical protein